MAVTASLLDVSVMNQPDKNGGKKYSSLCSAEQLKPMGFSSTVIQLRLNILKEQSLIL